MIVNIKNNHPTLLEVTSKAIYLLLLTCVYITGCNKNLNKDSRVVVNTICATCPQDLEKLAAFDTKLEAPQLGEWLSMHHEKGQTFEQYKGIKPVSPDSIHRKIYLQPIGQFTSVQEDIIAFNANYLNLFFFAGSGGWYKQITSFFSIMYFILLQAADRFLQGRAKKL